MEYKILQLNPPHAVVKYTNAGQTVGLLNVRIELDANGVPLQGAALDAYILAFAPAQVANPYDGVDWSPIAALVQPVVIPPEVIIEEKKAQVRVAREGILNRLAGIALAASIEDDQATQDAYVVARQGLLDITANWPADPSLIDALVMARYNAIVATLTTTAPGLITAFAGVDL